MSIETVEVTTEVVVDEAAQAAAAAALEAAKGGEGESTADETKAGETPPGNEASTEADEVVVTIGDAAPNKEEEELAKAPEWVRDLRKTNREQARRIRELERGNQAAVQATVLGPKPKMSDPEIDFDATKFEEALNKWNEQKRKSDQEATDRQAAEKKAQDDWQLRLNDYGEAKTKLKVRDFDEAEAIAIESLNQVQQGIIVQGCENAALVMYALGKNSAKLKELKAITDPVKFAFTVAKLEKDLKLTTRKAPPPPEKVVSGSAPKSGVVDSQLEKLRSEAERTGDYSKVTKYQREKRRAS